MTTQSAVTISSQTHASFFINEADVDLNQDSIEYLLFLSQVSVGFCYKEK